MRVSLLILFLFSFMKLNTQGVFARDWALKLNKENVLLVLNLIEMPFAKDVFTLIMLETGHLTSNYCKRYNNLFGMKYPRIRDKTHIKSKVKNKNLSSYSHWIDSILDFKMWFEYHNNKDGINTDFIDYIISKEFNNYSFYKKRFNNLKK